MSTRSFKPRRGGPRLPRPATPRTRAPARCPPPQGPFSSIRVYRPALEEISVEALRPSRPRHHESMEDDGTVAYKLLAAALMPINVILVLGAAALVLTARRRARAAAGAGAAAFLLLLAAATPAVSNAMVASLERRFLPVPPERSASADAIVVLGGCLAPERPPRLSAELGIEGAVRFAGLRTDLAQVYSDLDAVAL